MPQNTSWVCISSSVIEFMTHSLEDTVQNPINLPGSLLVFLSPSRLSGHYPVSISGSLQLCLCKPVFVNSSECSARQCT